ncbi:MAG: hypothetical protein JWO81_2707 [Alphaproteobacteria bacterium]|nr:hypothetical protein [Alphaproteobacteria bacterium]
MDENEGRALHWWQTWWGAGAIALFCALPLLWPTIPPLVDLPGHMAAYKVELDLAHSPDLQRYYTLHWAVVGNLGLNLLVIPLSRLFGLEPAVKLIVLCIPPITAAGFLWVGREAHGRIPPTALFAVPLAYCFPFIFGFVNFALSMALAFVAFGLWLRLGTSGRWRLRAALFPLISILIWFSHIFGWATLGIMAFAAELVREIDGGRRPIRAALRAGLQMPALLPPILLMLIWRTGDVAGKTSGWFSAAKIVDLMSPLRDRWEWLDLASILVLYGLIASAIMTKKLLFSRTLGVSAIFLMIAYLLLPQTIFGSSYADMRLLPYAVAVAMLAVRPSAATQLRLGPALGLLGLLFIGTRIAAATISFRIYDRSFQQELPALDHVPRGARLVSFVGTPCRGVWTMRRLDHLPAFAVIRREAISNDQWSVAGAQIDRVNYPQGGDVIKDPSQIVRIANCPGHRWRTLPDSIAHIPPGVFDYLWLIQPPAYDPALVRNMVPVWTNGRSTLFRIGDRSLAPGRAGPVMRTTAP